MPLYRPSELRSFLASINKEPLRFSSQRFLIDGNLVSKIVKEVKTQHVVEIGPGPGVLTEALLNAGHTVVAVEKDSDFARALTRLPGDLTVFERDILDCSLFELCKEDSLTVVSNLPYHLTTPIIEWLVYSNNLKNRGFSDSSGCLGITKMPSKAVLMMQKEAAVRLCSERGGYVPILLSFFGKVQYGFFVSRNSFWPKPHVDSAVITIERRDQSLLPKEMEGAFLDMVRFIFCYKRKTVLHSLKEFYGDRNDFPSAVCEIVNKRPEDLFVNDFLHIFQIWSSS